MGSDLENNNLFFDETTYDQEFNSYHFNKYQSCECSQCNYYTRVSLKHQFFYGILVPVIWVYLIFNYIYKYYISKNSSCCPKISDNITELTHYELEQFKKTYFNTADRFSNGTKGDDISTLINQSTTNYQEIFMRECCRDVFLFHEKIQKDCSIWVWRSFSAIMVYFCLIFLIVMLATNSASYAMVMK